MMKVEQIIEKLNKLERHELLEVIDFIEKEMLKRKPEWESLNTIHEEEKA
jgi:hypothetical protein